MKITLNKRWRIGGWGAIGAAASTVGGAASQVGSGLGQGVLGMAKDLGSTGANVAAGPSNPAFTQGMDQLMQMQSQANMQQPQLFKNSTPAPDSSAFLNFLMNMPR